MPDVPFTNLDNEVVDSVEDTVSSALDSLASRLGLPDFYSAHLLTHCHGLYLPSPLPNATLPASSIHKSSISCSAPRAAYAFDPTAALQATLDDAAARVGAGGAVPTLEDLDWPAQVDDAVAALRTASRAAFACYVLGFALALVSLVGGVVALFTRARAAAAANLAVAALGFAALGVASGVTTAVGVRIAAAVDEYGEAIGIEAHRGDKFLGLTWAAVGVMLVGAVWWGVETCFVGRGRRRGGKVYGDKGGY